MRLPILVSLLVAASLSAQEPARPTFDLREAFGVVRDDKGTPWAVGDDYKASWTPAGFTFTPALGRRARANRDLTLRLATIRRGEAIVFDAEAAQAPPASHLGERHIEIARGSLVERYDARRDGVEQSFVFAARPQGTGDLVVRLESTTAMAARTEADGTLLFHDGEVGGVRIGGVTGVDAAGHRCGGTLHVLDGSIELSLPAAFVDCASYPMTLDPLVGTAFLVGSSTDDDSRVDAAHGAADGNWLVVWQRTFSYFDQDIRAQRVSVAGALVGAPLTPFPTSTPETNPSVCYVRSRSMHLLCWNESTTPFGPFTLRARTLGISTFGAVATVSGSGGSSGGVIRTSGDRSNTGSKALVVWNSTGNTGTTIVTNTLDVAATGALTVGAAYDLSAASNFWSDSLVLAKSRLPLGHVLLGAAVPQFGVLFFVQPLTYDGAAVGFPASMGMIHANARRAFGIDGNGTDHVAAWHDASGTLQSRSVVWDGASLSLGAPTSIGGTPGAWLDVGFLGERFVVTWSEPTPNPFDDDLRGVALKPDCSICSDTFFLAQVQRPSALMPCVAPTFASGTGGGQALILWDERDIAPPFRGSVVGQIYQAMIGAPAVFLSAGCGNGGTASAVGAFSPGNDDFSFALAGGDPTAPFALISLSLGGSSILCGCELTNFIVLEATLAQGGASRYAFKPWCDPSYLGTDIEFQWLLWPAAQSPCPIVPNLAASNRMIVTLRP